MSPPTLREFLREVSAAAYVASGYVRTRPGYVYHLSELLPLIRLHTESP